MHFRLVFHDTKEDSEKEAVAEITVSPRVFAQKTALQVPVGGRVLVWDGHDYYSHHRRLNLAHPVIGKLGLTGNPGRYAYDFSLADESDMRSTGPLILLGAAVLLAFPIAGYLVAKASAAHSVVEPALAAGLALAALVAMLFVTAPIGVLFALAVAPLAFGLACGGAWFGLER